MQNVEGCRNSTLKKFILNPFERVGSATAENSKGFFILCIMTKEEIKDHYKGYEDSGFFIECTYEALKTKKPSQIAWFVKNHFMQYDKCDYDLMRKCGGHWYNVAFDKLNNYDFQNYIHSLLTSASYRMISKTMELYLN